LVKDDEQLSYGELTRRSNQVAEYLRKEGVNRNVCVGIITERDFESIINILGVIKAGGVYVPIESSYPANRIEQIISDSKCKLVITTKAYEKESLHTFPAIDKQLLNEPEDNAYIIYTSGSTGKPKGVVIQHQAALNTIRDMNERFHVTEKDTVLGISSLCFDLSVYDVFGSLNQGARLVLVSDPRDTEALSKMADQYQVTIWNSVPALIEMNVDYRQKGDIGKEVPCRLIILVFECYLDPNRRIIEHKWHKLWERRSPIFSGTLFYSSIRR
jgi:non-ribosomal peptide synthetase component F